MANAPGPLRTDGAAPHLSDMPACGECSAYFAPGEEPAHAESPAKEIACWRCGKLTPSESACRWCHASLRADSPLTFDAAAIEDSRRIIRLVIAYSILLVFAAIFGAIGLLLRGDVHRHDLLTFSVHRALLETLWTVVIVVALNITPRPPRLAQPSNAQRKIGWIIALPTLAVCLTLNFAYHAVLIHFLGDVVHLNPQDGGQAITPGIGDISFAIVAVCIQPGIFEELFFRYLAIGTLRTVMGRNGAVIVSSIMFGVAHIHVPLSIPILVVVGLGFGYVRTLSGSLVPTMLMHALHNGVVIWMEFAQ